jgi:hypothetical protein
MKLATIVPKAKRYIATIISGMVLYHSRGGE